MDARQIADAINVELVKMLDSGLIDEEQQEIISAMVENVITNQQPQMVEVVNERTQIFNGNAYHKSLKKKYYVRYVSLHKEVYETVHNMKIPDGYDVHHKDFNPDNNQPENLVLLTKLEHAQLHGQDGKLSRTCPICGTEFTATNPQKRYCSKKCQDKAWNKKRPKRIYKTDGIKKGDIEYQVKCEICGEMFNTKRPTRAKYCSDKCARRAWYLNNRHKFIKS